MPVTSGNFAPDPNDAPDGYVGTFTVAADPPPPECPARTFTVQINVATGNVNCQGGAPASGETTGASSSSNTQTTTPTGGPPPSYKPPPQSQSGSGTGMSNNGQGQTGGTSTAVQNANQQAGATTDPQGNPNG